MDIEDMNLHIVDDAERYAGMFDDIIEMSRLGQMRAVDILRWSGGRVKFWKLLREVHSFAGQFGDYKMRDADMDIHARVEAGHIQKIGTGDVEGAEDEAEFLITPKGYLEPYNPIEEEKRWMAAQASQLMVPYTSRLEDLYEQTTVQKRT